MPLQNRVTPLGELIAVPARGLVYGNRGCIHDAAGRIRPRHPTRRWIACRLEFKGWHRGPLLQPGKFTELFFLDEATSLAAGHRPCALCRRADYDRLAELWRRLHPGQVGADAIDLQLEAERRQPGSGERRLHETALDDLPDGAFVLHDGAAWLVLGSELLRWTPSGYAERTPRPTGQRAELITPPSLVELLRTDREPAVPLLHPSATGLPPQVAAYLVALAAELRRLLGSELVGVYAGGSLALAAYEHGRSDLDVAVVARGHVAPPLKRDLAAALDHRRLPCPARRLELVLYPLSVTSAPTTAPGFELNLNTGGDIPTRAELAPVDGESHWFAIDRSILARHGVALHGPPAATVFADIPRDVLVPLVADSLHWHGRGVGRGDDAVLNACRAYRFVREDVWSTKGNAGRWALERLEPRELVAEALEARKGIDTLEPDRVHAFVERVADLIGARRPGAGPPRSLADG